jgi:hypothetical protein
MVELKIKDVESLEAIVTGLNKNGYSCNSFIHWGKGKIDHFTVQIDLPEEPKAITSNTKKALEAIGRLTHGGSDNG